MIGEEGTKPIHVGDHDMKDSEDGGVVHGLYKVLQLEKEEILAPLALLLGR